MIMTYTHTHLSSAFLSPDSKREKRKRNSQTSISHLLPPDPLDHLLPLGRRDVLLPNPRLGQAILGNAFIHNPALRRRTALILGSGGRFPIRKAFAPGNFPVVAGVDDSQVEPFARLSGVVVVAVWLDAGESRETFIRGPRIHDLCLDPLLRARVSDQRGEHGRRETFQAVRIDQARNVAEGGEHDDARKGLRVLQGGLDECGGFRVAAEGEALGHGGCDGRPQAEPGDDDAGGRYAQRGGGQVVEQCEPVGDEAFLRWRAGGVPEPSIIDGEDVDGVLRRGHPESHAVHLRPDHGAQMCRIAVDLIGRSVSEILVGLRGKQSYSSPRLEHSDLRLEAGTRSSRDDPSPVHKTSCHSAFSHVFGIHATEEYAIRRASRCPA